MILCNYYYIFYIINNIIHSFFTKLTAHPSSPTLFNFSQLVRSADVGWRFIRRAGAADTRRIKRISFEKHRK